MKVCIWTMNDPEPNPDPLFPEVDPRIHTKWSGSETLDVVYLILDSSCMVRSMSWHRWMNSEFLSLALIKNRIKSISQSIYQSIFRSLAQYNQSINMSLALITYRIIPTNQSICSSHWSPTGLNQSINHSLCHLHWSQTGLKLSINHSICSSHWSQIG